MTTWRGPGDRHPADARLANTAAYLLESLHDTQIVPALGSAVFLRRGENVHRKTRSPRPFPPDVIERVDTLIVDNPATDPTLRSMIATTRWAGCRISELVALPIDCLHRSDAGYWIEYWMPKPGPGADSPSRTASQPSSSTSRPACATPTAPTPSTYSPAPGSTPPPAAPTLVDQRPAAPPRRTVHRTRHHHLDHHRRADLRRRCAPLPAHHRNHTAQQTAGPNKVRDFLGHHSDTMTSAYARITDDTGPQST